MSAIGEWLDAQSHSVFIAGIAIAVDITIFCAWFVTEILEW